MYLELKIRTRRYDWVFKGLKRTRNVRLMFLEVNIQQVRKDWCIQMLKCNKQGTNNVFRSENVTKKIKLGYLKIKKQHEK